MPKRLDLITEDQVKNWILGLVEDMKVYRQRCNIIIPNPTKIQIDHQRRDLWTFLQKQGKVMGALELALYTGSISEVMYEELASIATNSLAPTLVGIV